MPSERCWFYRWCTRGKFHWGQGKAWGRKLETEARQQYRTKFVNSVYEIHIIAMTDDGWCMLVSVQWLPPPPATMPLIYKPKYVPFCHLKVKWTKVFEAGSGNYNHWLCNLAAFCATRHCRPPSLSRAKWSQSFMAHSTSVSTERQVDGFLVIAVSQRQALLQFCAHLFFHLYKSKLPPPMMPLILQTEIYAILSSWTIITGSAVWQLSGGSTLWTSISVESKMKPVFHRSLCLCVHNEQVNKSTVKKGKFPIVSIAVS